VDRVRSAALNPSTLPILSAESVESAYFIRCGRHPQQNGRHERMHLTLKKEATRRPGLNRAGKSEFWRATTDDDEHYVYAIAL
jgi:hypothetical protein